MTAPESPAPEPTPGPFRKRRYGKYLAIALAGPLLLLALYTWLVLHWDYSNGYRSGMLQKISKKGWVCKTYEGELWQSVVAQVAPNVWNFSVRDERIARQLDSLVGQSVRVHYTEHRGVPTTCFGETPYFVDSVSVVAGP